MSKVFECENCTAAADAPKIMVTVVDEINGPFWGTFCKVECAQTHLNYAFDEIMNAASPAVPVVLETFGPIPNEAPATTELSVDPILAVPGSDEEKVMMNFDEFVTSITKLSEEELTQMFSSIGLDDIKTVQDLNAFLENSPAVNTPQTEQTPPTTQEVWDSFKLIGVTNTDPALAIHCLKFVADEVASRISTPMHDRKIDKFDPGLSTVIAGIHEQYCWTNVISYSIWYVMTNDATIKIASSTGLDVKIKAGAGSALEILSAIGEAVELDYKGFLDFAKQSAST